MTEALAPAYEQVKAWLRGHIASGQWRPGDAVPSETALMEQFGVSRMTANRAVRELANEGWVLRVQGSGTRVAALHRISSRLELRDIHEEIVERGHVHSTKVIEVLAQRAPTAVSKSLGLAARAQVFHSVVVHLENGVPIQFEDRYVNPAVAPGYLECDFTQTTATHFLLEHAPITEANYRIEAALPSPQEAFHLGLSALAPCLVMHRRTVSAERVASVARLVYPGSRYNFAGQFQA